MPPAQRQPGYIYAIKLHPDLNLVKIGWAGVGPVKDPKRFLEHDPAHYLKDRLKSARTWMASAEIIKAWPSWTIFEAPASEWMTFPAPRVGDREQWEVEDINELVRQGDLFFARIKAPDLPSWEELRASVEAAAETDQDEEDEE